MSGIGEQGARDVIKQTPVKGSDKVRVNFVLPKDSVAGKVSVVGDFNGWDPYVHPLRPRSNGTRSVSVTLPVSQRFAFRYLDENGHWLDDDSASEYVDNGVGGVNSVVRT
jgi:1,4-alpha-glucan branching enzyme